ncbi:uncharacterized protein Ecym_5396 [Eremothecium cymbalariae DBVPG|uniref:Fork-head domain-containing protein n=1 Tax=Eremothecium cymbalariae (strain CBS 270.75 / DBVPG 7215 / KCTC 17166 / NRRL Y-17582) TaxID=931890 RepID=I6NDK9_ERECY|nr:hypothetical protein Ecym_5396 [Eremothecium cymbalariae DBVPG\
MNYPFASHHQQDLINAVISVLDAPKEATTVSQVYSNEKNTATEVQAYAKISGKDWTYYVKDMITSIGRNTSPQDHSIHIDLGPAKVVSRQHASISFNLNTGIWELRVLGRNGAKINFHRIPSGPNTNPVPLSSGTILDIGGTQMMFILPDQGPFIDPSALSYLNPKLAAAYAHTTTNPLLQELIKNAPLPTRDVKGPGDTQMTTFKMYHNQYQAPTQYHDQNSNHGAMYGTIIDPGFPNSKDLATDLSRDENRNVKPPHSYATMITQAILCSHDGELSLSAIYKYISANYAFYRHTKSGWQNSIRHNLSLNKAFEKVPRKPGEPGKGMKWRISEDYQREFLEKWHTGRIGKVRRGSSVARQLQLHMSRYNNLPIQNASNSNITQRQQQQQQPQKEQQQIQPESQQLQQNQLSSMQSSLSASSSTPSATYSTASNSHGSPVRYHSPPSQENIPQGKTRVPQTTMSLPIRQSQTTVNQQKLSVSRETPPPPPAPQQQQQQQKPRPSQLTASTSNTSLPSLSGLRASPQPSLSAGTLPTTAPQLSPVNDSLLHSPPKRFHISAVEAYTPERGSQHISRSPTQSGGGGLTSAQLPQQQTQMLNSGNLQSHNGQPLTNQSSPGVWNLLQFSSVNNTPATNAHGSGAPNFNSQNSGPVSASNSAATAKHSHDPVTSSAEKDQTLTSSPITKNRAGKNDDHTDGKLILDTDSAKVSLVKSDGSP